MQEKQTVRFGPYHFEPHNAQLRRGRRVLPLTRKAGEVLRCLVTHPGQLVTKDALFQAVWPETVVSEGGLTNCIAELRQALGDDAKRPRFIATVHRQGYRFIALLSPPAPAPGAALQAPDLASAAGRSRLAVPLPVPQPSPPPLVGREAELAHLHRLYTRALHGQRHVVFVTGEAGIGKTALVETFVQGLRHEPALWIGHGQCIEQYGAGEAYLPLLEALERLCQGPGGERLVTLLAQYAPSWVVQFPVLLSASALADLQHTLAGITRARMLRELSVALDVVSAAYPLVLVLEDLHWSDPSTVEALAMLARRREPARLLVLGTYRAAEVVVHDHPLKTVKHELIARGQGVEVALSYLSPAAVHAYVVARAEEHGAAAALAPAVYRRTDGHPLFMVQVTDYLAQTGEPLLATPTALGTLEQALPQGLRELIEAQMGRLTAEEQQVLEVGSVAGAVFAVASVAAVLQLSDATLEAVCERLARRGQFIEDRGLETWPDGTVSGRYGFRHALYQEVLYNRLGSGWQARLHRQIGERLEHAYREQAREVAAELAVHFERGRDWQRAVRYLQRAGENVLQRYAYQEATGHFRRGLALVPQLPETPVRLRQELDLQIGLGSALHAVQGQTSLEVEQAYSRARELCQQVGETPQLLAVLQGLGWFYTARAEHQTACEVGEQLLRLAQDVQEPALLLEAQQSLGLSLCFLGEFVRAREHLEHGIAVYERQPREICAVSQVHVAGAVCLSYAARVLWVLGYPEQALAPSLRAVACAREFASPYTLAHTLYFAAALCQFRRDNHLAHEWLDALMVLDAEQGFPLHAAYGTVLRGWMQGAEGIAQMRQGLTALQAMRAGVSRPYVLTLLAEAYGKVGQDEAGLRVLAEARAAVQSTGERFYEAEIYRLQGALLLQGAVPYPLQAEMCLQHALETARSQQAKSFALRAALSLSQLWQQQGKRAEALELLAPVYGWFTEGFDTADLQEARALLEALS